LHNGGNVLGARRERAEIILNAAREALHGEVLRVRDGQRRRFHGHLGRAGERHSSSVFF